MAEGKRCFYYMKLWWRLWSPWRMLGLKVLRKTEWGTMYDIALRLSFPTDASFLREKSLVCKAWNCGEESLRRMCGNYGRQWWPVRKRWTTAKMDHACEKRIRSINEKRWVNGKKKLIEKNRTCFKLPDISCRGSLCKNGNCFWNKLCSGWGACYIGCTNSSYATLYKNDISVYQTR